MPKTHNKKVISTITYHFILLREPDSNERPLGYEPNELPLLHPAIYSILKCKSTSLNCVAKIWTVFQKNKLINVKIKKNITKYYTTLTYFIKIFMNSSPDNNP